MKTFLNLSVELVATGAGALQVFGPVGPVLEWSAVVLAASLAALLVRYRAEAWSNAKRGTEGPQ